MYYLGKLCFLTVALMACLSDNVVHGQYREYYPVYPGWAGHASRPEGKRQGTKVVDSQEQSTTEDPCSNCVPKVPYQSDGSTKVIGDNETSSIANHKRDNIQQRLLALDRWIRKYPFAYNQDVY